MQRIEGKKSRQRGDQINQLSAEERAERDRAKTVVIASNAGGEKRGDRMRERNNVTPLPVATRDSSSSANALAANSN